REARVVHVGERIVGQVLEGGPPRLGAVGREHAWGFAEVHVDVDDRQPAKPRRQARRVEGALLWLRHVCKTGHGEAYCGLSGPAAARARSAMSRYRFRYASGVIENECQVGRFAVFAFLTRS